MLVRVDSYLSVLQSLAVCLQYPYVPWLFHLILKLLCPIPLSLLLVCIPTVYKASFFTQSTETCIHYIRIKSK